MKLLKLLGIAILLLNVCDAQTKKAADLKSNLDPATAGKYAKDFARKMYNSIDFEPNKSEYTLSINKWKPYTITKEDNSKVTWYMIDVTIRWKSAQDGWPTIWKDVEYSGLILCDEFGCEPNILIKAKKEPSSSGLAALVVKGSPVGELNDEQKQGIAMMDEWCRGVNYVWNPGGCLE